MNKPRRDYLGVLLAEPSAPTTWQADATCRGDLGWLDKPVALQLADCHQCPVATQCLEFARDMRCTHVVMGGIILPDRPLKTTPTP